MNKNLEACIQASTGEKRAALVLKNAQVVNVFTASLEKGDVAIQDGYIVGIGNYQGEREVDLAGDLVCPGLIDGHIHLESSMVSPREFAKAVLPHGTTAVITDPHEIANVAGGEGIQFMLDQTRGLPLDVYFMLPSCVPATGLDESGAVLEAADLEPFYQEERVLGLAELMNSYGTTKGDPEILRKAKGALSRNKLVDGHAPGLGGKDLNAYVVAGVTSDHECSTPEEAMEKLGRGQWIMIREGTAAKNLEQLLPLFGDAYYRRCMLVTDDKHPGDLVGLGHMDYMIRKAASLGADPIRGILMASFHGAQYFRLWDRGAVAPGYRADLLVVSDLENFTVRQVYKDGRLVAENGKLVEGERLLESAQGGRPPRVYDSFHLKEITSKDLDFPISGAYERVLWLTPHELATKEVILPYVEKEGYAPGVDPEKDVVKMAVFERHKNTGHVGLGFLGGYGLKKGAVASSIAHDSHNLIIAGTNNQDMALAGNTVRKNRGGLALVAGGKVLGELALPIAGLMSHQGAAQVGLQLEALKQAARQMGVREDIDPFMTLAFASLPVIPQLRLNTYGLIDTLLHQVVAPLLPVYPEKNKKA